MRLFTCEEAQSLTGAVIEETMSPSLDKVLDQAHIMALEGKYRLQVPAEFLTQEEWLFLKSIGYTIDANCLSWAPK